MVTQKQRRRAFAAVMAQINRHQPEGRCLSVDPCEENLAAEMENKGYSNGQMTLIALAWWAWNPGARLALSRLTSLSFGNRRLAAGLVYALLTDDSAALDVHLGEMAAGEFKDG